MCHKFISFIISNVSEPRMSQNSESIIISFYENETKSTQISEEGESSN